MKIAIGTTSKLKVHALEEALDKLDIKEKVLATKTNSGISNQPFGYDEIIKGAKNRAQIVLKEFDADIGVGVENGLVEIGENYFDIACIFLSTKDGETSTAFSSAILMPKWIIDEIKEKNTEVGEITMRLSGDTEKDGFKYFTDGVITRKEALIPAIIFAFSKILNKDKFINI
jgi:inosine/xanthosine triphosphatase